MTFAVGMNAGIIPRSIGRMSVRGSKLEQRVKVLLSLHNILQRSLLAITDLISLPKSVRMCIGLGKRERRIREYWWV